MKRILILRSDDHIFDRTDYKNYKPVNGENIGNKLWLMGLISSISGKDCTIEYENKKLDVGFINENYDMCIKPSANLFGEYFAHWMDDHVKKYAGVKIPIHVIAVGAQAKSYDELDDLAEKIKPSAVSFIESIDRTGGTFALRGYFTEALLKRLGYNKAFVTGCPSLFQLGLININKGISLEEELKTAFNGNLKLSYDFLIKRMSAGDFFDQSVFFDVICSDDVPDYSTLLKKYGLYGTRLLMNKKVRLIIDMPDWMNYLKTEGFNFSFGTRIHGSIMSLLSGIPALVIPPDTRVQEMCEFFEIPTTTYKEARKSNLIDLYHNADYTAFNSNFAARLQYYIDYLQGIGIEYNADSLFFKEVLQNKYTMNSEFDAYVSHIDNVKTNKNSELFYMTKEIGKSVLKKV